MSLATWIRSATWKRSDTDGTTQARDWRAVSIGEGVVIAFLVAGLVVQHSRGGWPFSAHATPEAAQASEHAAHRSASTESAAPHALHARAAVVVAPSQLSAIGVRIEWAKRESISRPFRAVATVVPDESRVSHVHTRVSGWIERLSINTTGQRVRAGQPLAGIFSQELLSSQNEYIALRQSAGSAPPSSLLAGARARLSVLGMTDGEIRAIEGSNIARRLVTVSAPRGGIVLHRGISVGTAVDPSTELVTIADLSQVWVVAEIPESDIPNVEKGMAALLDFPASGRAPFESTVEFLYPTLSERTRTLRVRLVAANPDGALRPGLYGTAQFQVNAREAVTVPRDAIVDTGDSQHVFVVEGEGRFSPRTVEIGVRLGDRVEIRRGLESDESVVASGVFLIDSESRLRASGGGGETAETGGHSGH